MKLSVEEIEEIIGYVQIAKQFAPIADDVVETVFAFSPALKRLADALLGWVRESTVSTFQFYLDKRFSREEAMMLTIDARVSFQVLAQNKSNNKKNAG